MFEHRVEAGDMVIKQGDDGDFFYVVEEGAYHALIDIEDGSMKKVFEYNGDGNFGELALLYNMPRAASIQVAPGPPASQAQTAGSLWAMDRQTFRKIVLKSAFQKRKMYESFLESVSLLQHLEVIHVPVASVNTGFNTHASWIKANRFTLSHISPDRNMRGRTLQMPWSARLFPKANRW